MPSERPPLIDVEVSDDLAKMLDQFPLPPGVQDADCNQGEIAQALNTSVNTVAKWIKTEGFPVAQQGGNGKEYVLRLSHCWAWRRAQEAAADQRSKHNRDQITALQASFLGLTIEDPNAQMTAQERREAAQADIAWSKARHLRRQLVPLADVVDLLEAVCRLVREGLEAMPDRLERELALKPEQVMIVSRTGRDVLQSVYERIDAHELREKDVPDVEVQRQWVI